VDALYSEAGSVHIDTAIKYEDGRQVQIVTDLKIIPITA